MGALTSLGRYGAYDRQFENYITSHSGFDKICYHAMETNRYGLDSICDAKSNLAFSFPSSNFFMDFDLLEAY